MESADFGTPQLKNHLPLEIHGDGKRAYARVLNHPLDRYLERREINFKQYQAGCSLFNDYQISHATKNSFSLLGVEKVDHTPAPDGQPVAFDRYMKAIKSLNKISRQMVGKVCVDGYFLKQICGDFGWSKKNTGMDRFKEALDDLAEFYEEQYKIS